jgi:GAF domain-containing protein/anti-sigma regulatory factor (Ser/Thr protein kinase)
MSSAVFDQVIADLPLGVLLVEADGTVRACNERARRILGTAGVAAGVSLKAMIAADAVADLPERTLRFGESSVRVERRDREGRRQWVHLIAASASGAPAGTIVVVLQDVTLPAVAERVVDRSLRETELLNAIAGAASGETDLERILSSALEHLQTALSFTGASIALIEEDHLVIRAAAGPFAGQALGQRLRRGTGRSWQVILTGEPFFSGDVQAEGARPTTDIRSYLAVPLAWAGRSFGLLELDSTEPGAFRPSDVDLLRRVAALLSGPVQLALRLDTEVRALEAADQARRRVVLVAEASRILASSLDYETTLTNVARLLVPAAADWVLVDVIDGDGKVRSIALAHMDTEREELIRELRRRYPPDAARGHPIFTVAHTGASIVENDLTPDDLRNRARDDAHLALFEALGIRADLIVPLIVRGRVLGVLSFVTSTPGRRFEREDLELAEEIGRRAARAIDTAQLYAAEQRARAEAEEAVRRINALNNLTTLVASAMNLDAVFDELGEILRTLIPFVRVTVSLYVPETDALTMPLFKGPPLSAPAARLEGPKRGTARGWVLDHNRAFVRADTQATQEFSEDAILRDAGIRSYIIVPMRAGSRAIGTLNFSHDRPEAYGEAHVRIAQPIADQLALAVSRYQLFEQTQRRAGELSETLQRALLPAGLPEPPFTSIGALYLPADPQAGIGGDWYDALHLPDDSILLSLGDVAGHGISAAAAMGQVRHIVRAYALEGRAPGEVLSTVNRYLCHLPEGPQLSLWLAIVDPYSGIGTISGGGHPPVLLVAPDGEIESLPCTGPPLGLVPTSTYPEHRRALAPGARLIASTDGLIEAARDIIGNEPRLRAAAWASRRVGPRQAAEIIAREVLRGHTHEDDVAILIFDLLDHDAPLAFGVPASPELLHRVRRAIRVYAIRAGVPRERVEEVVFAVGEASLNTVEHAYRGAPGLLRLQAERQNGRLVVRVRDDGAWREPVDRGRGRGMRLMHQFADDVVVETGSDGTVVTLTWALEANPR